MSLRNVIAATAATAAISTAEIREKLLKGLNPEQKAIVEHGDGPLLSAAVAGSGKTHALVRRIGYLTKVRGINPRRVLAVTFSRKGADEMNERLAALIGESGARVGTFHSLAYQILREEGLCDGWTVDDRDRYRYCIKDAVGFRNMKWKQADVTLLSHFISLCKCDLARPDSDRAIEIAESLRAAKPTPSANVHRMLEAYDTAEEIRKERLLLTFDDMLLDCCELLQGKLRDQDGNRIDGESVRTRWAGRWDYVLQDEAQDQNLGQLIIGELLSKDHKNYHLVGDPAQCHPPGTMILTDTGETPIEHLTEDSSTVKSWNRKAQKIIGERHIQIASRHYDGPLYEMYANNSSVKMTDNHKVLCRWTKQNEKLHVTYLMYRSDLGFRVGHCKLFSSRGNKTPFSFHLATRANLEKAEKTWVLKVHQDSRASSIHESILAATYGIPTATFNPVHKNESLDNDAIKEIFSAVGPRHKTRALQCLADHGRDETLPLLPFPPQEIEGKTDKDVAFRQSTYFPVYACNLIPGLMSIPLPHGRNKWSDIDKITSRHYEGPVYSLDVEKDHSYVANGLVVLNCIFTWRGAKPEKLLGFEKTWGAKKIIMNRNYRCGQQVIDIANRVLQSMDPETRLDTEMICELGTESDVKCHQYTDLDDEGEALALEIKELIEDGTYQPRDIAILYRTNAQSRAPEESLIGERIPYRIIGGVNFYERREVRDLLAYLRLAEGRGELDDVARCINTPFRYLGKKFVEAVRETAKEARAHSRKTDERVSYPQIVRAACKKDRTQSRQRYSAEDWADLIEHTYDRIHDETPTPPAQILEDIVRATRYTEWLTRDEGEETPENSRVSNVRELVRAASRFPTVSELLDYIDKTIKASKNQRKKGQAPNKVTLTTLHRSKGMEWPVVYVIGANDGILPHARCEDIEEERRLFYVGVTRSKEVLRVSCVEQAAIGNRVIFLAPSQFISEGEIAVTNVQKTAPSLGDPRDV